MEPDLGLRLPKVQVSNLHSSPAQGSQPLHTTCAFEVHGMRIQALQCWSRQMAIDPASACILNSCRQDIPAAVQSRQVDKNVELLGSWKADCGKQVFTRGRPPHGIAHDAPMQASQSIATLRLHLDVLLTGHSAHGQANS